MQDMLMAFITTTQAIVVSLLLKQIPEAEHFHCYSQSKYLRKNKLSEI